MNLKSGWLERQCAAATIEVMKWTPQKRELIICASGRDHKFVEQSINNTQEIQKCTRCDRMRVRYSWQQPFAWIEVRRGSEGQVEISGTPDWDLSL